MSVVQFTDTHIRALASIDGNGTDVWLRRALDAVAALSIDLEYIVVTGDLVDRGTREEYVRFAEIMRASPVPYYVIPGNHDVPSVMRDALPPETFGGVREARSRYAVDGRTLRTIALDVTRERPQPGARIDGETFDWLEATLAERPDAPTMIAVHQPPFRTGLHYLDVFGFTGARRLRAIVERRPNVGLVLCGHVHCIKRARWSHALAASAPSTAPMFVPELFERHPLWLRFERPGFAVHALTPERGFQSTVYRHDVATDAWRAEPSAIEPTVLAAR